MKEIFIHIKDDFFPAIVFSMFFVWALVMWVREGDNDEQLQNQIDGKERVMKIGDEVYVHGYVDEIRNDCIIIRNEGGYFGTITSEITADRKTEPQTKCYLRTSCDHYGDKQVCRRCREYNLYSHTKTEPQMYITEDRDAQILDAWQVHHRNTTSIEGEPQTVSLTSAHISGDIYHKVGDEPQMRDATAEERQSVRNYIKSIEKDTGVRFYEDEP